MLTARTIGMNLKYVKISSAGARNSQAVRASRRRAAAPGRHHHHRARGAGVTGAAAPVTPAVPAAGRMAVRPAGSMMVAAADASTAGTVEAGASAAATGSPARPGTGAGTGTPPGVTAPAAGPPPVPRIRPTTPAWSARW